MSAAPICHDSDCSVDPSDLPPTPASEKLLFQQLDVIVLDVSGSMKGGSSVDPDMTREDLSKLVFHTMVDKLLCLEMDHVVGLVSFGAEIAVFDVTEDYEVFHTQLGRLDANQRSTRLFDAIAAAAELLRQHREKHAADIQPNAPLRIFALTDGEDNASTAKPWEVARLLQEHKVVLDVFPMACRNVQLHALSLATGGVCVDVTSVEQGTSRFEDETLLHVASRPEAALPEHVTSLEDFNRIVSTVPAPAAARTVVVTGGSAVPTMTRDAAATARIPASRALPTASASGSSAAVRRIMREFSEAVAEGFGVYVCDNDVFQWKVLLPGAEHTPYALGHFVVSFHVPADYPFKPPKVRFLTPMYHCNVNDAGSVCLDILKDAWSPALTSAKVLRSLLSLMTDPNPDDPLDSVKATVLRQDVQQYNRLAAESASRWAAPLAMVMSTYGLASQPQ